MTYSIYVDLAFGWAFAINFVLLYVSERLLKNNVSLHRICIDSLIISLICTGEYVMFYSCNPILQNTLYVLTYFLLLYLMYKLRSPGVPLLLTYAVYVLISFAVSLLLMLVSYSLKMGILQTVTTAFCIVCAVPAVCIMGSHKRHTVSYRSCVYPVELNVNGNNFITRAYMDTGNGLRDLSGREVIITDYSYASKLLGNAYVSLLYGYGISKKFDYVKANSISDIRFCPVSYRTVSSEFCMMPGFTADSILFVKTGRQYRDITIAISPNGLMLKENAKLLSNQSLKP